MSPLPNDSSISHADSRGGPDPTNPRCRIAIVGGGISGLAAALRLEALQPTWQVELLEQAPRLGGILGSHRVGEYLIEQAADNFLRGPTAPWAEQLCERYGLADQLIPTDPARRGAHVGWRGELHPIPEGFQLVAPARLLPLLATRLLSWPGKLRMVLEPLIRESRTIDDESLRDFATRRLGREAYERLVEPLVSGIYTADPRRLSMPAALPQMVEMVRQHGSLYRAMRQRARASRNDRAHDAATRGARYSLFVAPRGGMTEWLELLRQRLQATRIHFETSVQQIRAHAGGGWSLETSEPALRGPWDGVLTALPAQATADILGDTAPAVAKTIGLIPLASSAVVCLGFPLTQIGRPLNAFGCVIPAIEKRSALAISYTSLKFPGRAPQQSVLLRVFLGGALHPEVMDLSDEGLIDLACQETRHWLHTQGEPEVVRVVRWQRAMPQYELGHRERIAQIERELVGYPGLEVTGNWLRGVGIPQCVREAEQAAERMVAQLAAQNIR